MSLSPFSSPRRPLSSFAEEIFHQLSTLFLQDAGGDLRARMQDAGSEEAISALRVARAVNDATDLRPPKCSSTHGAGFDGDVERAVVKILPAERLRCRGDGLHLSVSRGVPKGLDQIETATNDVATADNYRSYGYFLGLPSLLGFVQCLAHVVFVVLYHVCYELDHAYVSGVKDTDKPRPVQHSFLFLWQ